MVFNFSQLIKFFRYRDLSCCQDTVYLGCRPTLSWHKFLQSHLDSFTVTPNSAPSTGIRPSTGIIQSDSFTVPLNSQPSTGIIPSRQICLDNETFSHLPGFLSGPKTLSRLPVPIAIGICKNSCQRVPLSATKLNRRAVSIYVAVPFRGINY